MGLLDLLLGNTKLGNQDIATDMLKDSKFAIISLSKAITEVTNPELKRLLENQLLTTIDQHHQLSDLVTERDWYQPFLSPQEQFRNDVLISENVTN